MTFLRYKACKEALYRNSLHSRYFIDFSASSLSFLYVLPFVSRFSIISDYMIFHSLAAAIEFFLVIMKKEGREDHAFPPSFCNYVRFSQSKFVQENNQCGIKWRIFNLPFICLPVDSCV